jgi:hypothetical protein
VGDWLATHTHIHTHTLSLTLTVTQIRFETPNKTPTAAETVSLKNKDKSHDMLQTAYLGLLVPLRNGFAVETPAESGESREHLTLPLLSKKKREMLETKQQQNRTR